MVSQSAAGEPIHKQGQDFWGTMLVDLLASQIFGESVDSRCWRYFNLAKSCCNCYTYNGYETILALFKFGGQPKSHQTAKLKSLPTKLHIWYIYIKKFLME